jgi:hypothetical protein
VVAALLPWGQVAEREVLLVAIAIQESGLKHRRQIGGGPARSWWQIEPDTAIDTFQRCLPIRDVWEEFPLGDELLVELEHSEIRACAIAAGILRLTPGRLPAVGDEDAAWQYYLKAWRPGKPRPGPWHKAYSDAEAAQVLGAPMARMDYL